MSKPKNLVLSGGGIKGIHILGALQFLHENNMLANVSNFAGTSVGAMICGLMAIGYTPKEMFDILFNVDIMKLRNMNVPSVFENFGVDDGEKITKFIKILIKNKTDDPEITLLDVYNKYKKNTILQQLCWNNRKAKFLNYKETQTLQLWLAIRMSICVPLFFCPVNYQNNLYIDGALCDNFPMDVFANDMDNTLGICVYNDCSCNNPTYFETYLFGIIKCSMIRNKNADKYKKNTIVLSDPETETLDFGINDIMKFKMFSNGYNIAHHFFINESILIAMEFCFFRNQFIIFSTNTLSDTCSSKFSGNPCVMPYPPISVSELVIANCFNRASRVPMP